MSGESGATADSSSLVSGSDGRIARKLVKVLCENGGRFDFDEASWAELYPKLNRCGVDNEMPEERRGLTGDDLMEAASSSLPVPPIETFVGRFPKVFMCIPTGRRNSVTVSKNRAHLGLNGLQHRPGCIVHLDIILCHRVET